MIGASSLSADGVERERFWMMGADTFWNATDAGFCRVIVLLLFIGLNVNDRGMCKLLQSVLWYILVVYEDNHECVVEPSVYIAIVFMNNLKKVYNLKLFHLWTRILLVKYITCELELEK